jgi:hypothetical protein
MYTVNGKKVSRAEFNKSPSKINEIFESGDMMSQSTRCYPFYSHSASVGYENVDEARGICTKAGIPTEFNSDGEPKFTGKKHRQKYCKEFGLYDRNAGYGDQAPTCEASTDSKTKLAKRQAKNRQAKMGL